MNCENCKHCVLGAMFVLPQQYAFNFNSLPIGIKAHLNRADKPMPKNHLRPYYSIFAHYQSIGSQHEHACA
jgi:hypothetical protein